MVKLFTDRELCIAGLAFSELNDKLLKQKNKLEEHIKRGDNKEDYSGQLKLIYEQIEDIKTLTLKLIKGPEESVIYL